MTQKQLADTLGVSESRIGMYERGKREPDFEMLEAIADYFNVDMDYLTGRSDVERQYSFQPEPVAAPVLSWDQQDLLESYDQLNDEGKLDLRKHARVMVLSGQYASDADNLLVKDH